MLGHRFKHSPAIGEAVSQRLTGETPGIDLSAFSLGNAVEWTTAPGAG